MPLIVDQVDTTETLMNMARRGDLAAARALFTERVKIRQIEEIRIRIAQMERAEAELLRLRVEREQKQRRLLQFVFASTGILLLVLGAATYLLVRRYTNDLTSARDRLYLLNTDLESAVAERTADLKRANEFGRRRARFQPCRAGHQRPAGPRRRRDHRQPVGRRCTGPQRAPVTPAPTRLL